MPTDFNRCRYTYMHVVQEKVVKIVLVNFWSGVSMCPPSRFLAYNFTTIKPPYYQLPLSKSFGGTV